MTISNIWDATNHTVKWAFHKNYKLYDNRLMKNPQPDLDKSTVVWVIGIRLADIFPSGTIEVKALVPNGYSYRVVGPHHGGRVRRQDLHKITILCSPLEAMDPQERQVQQLNYDTFVSVMAEMIQKYAPKILQ